MGYIQSLAEYWNSGFIFENDFVSSKQFKRYCTKLENAAQAFLVNAINSYNDELTDISLCRLTWSFFVNIVNNDFEEDQKGDWRYILTPLVRCVPWRFNETDDVVKNGWRIVLSDDAVWQSEVFEACMPIACIQYLHSMFIKNKGINKSNFCIKALPNEFEDIMLFIKLLLNVIWTDVYTNIVWAQQDRAIDALKVVDLEKENKRLLATINDMQNKIFDYTDVTIPFYEKKIAEMKQTQAETCQREVSDYKAKVDGELAAERKKAKQLEAEVARLKEKNRELTEQLEILDEAEGDGEDNAPITKLNYNSKIVFIAAPPPNGRVEGTFKRLAQKFPNSRLIHSADDICFDADCYVLLTRYMRHHGLYNATHDLLLRRNYPYIHSGKQNVDRIAYDIFAKTRYSDNR